MAPQTHLRDKGWWAKGNNETFTPHLNRQCKALRNGAELKRHSVREIVDHETKNMVVMNITKLILFYLTFFIFYTRFLWKCFCYV